MPFILIGLIWFILATVAGISGVPARLRPPTPQLVLLALTAVLVAAGRFNRPFRRWLMSLDWRALVALHVSRLVGIVFLLCYQGGELPYAFAVPGGIGDIAVAVLAMMLLAAANAVVIRPSLLLVWNVLGLADILFVVFTAARLAIADPASMAALFQFPLSLVPTFLVPLIIGSHVLIFVRLKTGTLE